MEHGYLWKDWTEFGAKQSTWTRLFKSLPTQSIVIYDAGTDNLSLRGMDGLEI